MNISRTTAAVAAIALSVGLSCVPVDAARAAAPAPAAPALIMPTAVKFKNCTKLNKKYKHGVGKKGAKDKVRGRTKKVTSFKRGNALYAANRHLDRDKDGIACEKR